MAHKKGVGSSRNGRESHSKRLGVKRFGGQTVTAGCIYGNIRVQYNRVVERHITVHGYVTVKVRARIARCYIQ